MKDDARVCEPLAIILNTFMACKAYQVDIVIIYTEFQTKYRQKIKTAFIPILRVAVF
jgi:hypothetical protein